MRVSFLALAATTAAGTVLASHGAASNAHRLAARNPDLIGDILNPITGGVLNPITNILLPSRSFTCSGAGSDGWTVDWQGSSAPSWCPTGWRWFGVSYGWQPVVGWKVPSSSWTYPIQWSPSQCSWWTPPAGSKPPTSSSSFVTTSKAASTSNAAPSTTTTTTSAAPAPTPDYPSKDWECDGSGNDGKDVDYNGNGCPSYMGLGGFKWFGTSIGWAPTPGFEEPSDWRPCSDELAACSAVWWYYPSLDYVLPAGVTCPPIWLELGWIDKRSKASSTSATPSSTTKSAAPSATATYLWGSGCPDASWDEPKNWAPSLTELAYLGDCYTWYPSDTYLVPAGVAAPASWLALGWIDKRTKSSSSSAAPSTTTTTSAAPSATATYSWGSGCPDASWDEPKDWSPSAGELAVLGDCYTWYPSANYLLPVGVTAPASWLSLGWIDLRKTSTSAAVPSSTTTSAAPAPTADVPSPSWQCDGSGNDGKQVDHNGNHCPSSLGDGNWLWWGTNLGWLPHFSWDNSLSWKPSSTELEQLGKCSWWYPSPDYVLPSGAICPWTWTVANWIDLRKPSSSFECSSSGEDGFDLDYNGNQRPSWSVHGFKWFGKSHGWQPCKAFKLPSATWAPSSSWDARTCSWWTPNVKWTITTSGFKCPSFWPSSLLSGSIFWWL